MTYSLMKVLVIGDSCTDVFIYGDIKRICPEAPVPVFNPTDETENPGMASNVVENLKSLGCDTDIITNNNGIRKVRYVDNRSNQMVMRVDENDSCEPLDTELLHNIRNDYDAVIVSDYCKGFLSDLDIKYICDNFKNVFVDTKKQIGDWITNAKYIKINEFEHLKNFELIPNYPSIKKKLIVTGGSKGCVHNGKHYPVEEVPVKDVSGAGDTFISGLVFNYVRTRDIQGSILFAQKCTTKVVQKHGVSTIKIEEL